MDKQKSTEIFLTLVYSLQMQAMMNLGKLKNPMTEKIEKNVEASQVSIDMLEMLLDKTENNLSDDEKKLLEHVISDLKLNYVEELNKKE
ncbi:MAG: DUF1844 domain-containing protein [Bacteroidetes bacterium]|nr:DUF1844 domain-containing protein [Bacteroidota bacterium]